MLVRTRFATIGFLTQERWSAGLSKHEIDLEQGPRLPATEIASQALQQELGGGAPNIFQTPAQRGDRR